MRNGWITRRGDENKGTTVAMTNLFRNFFARATPLGMRKLSMSRLGVCWRDAVLGVPTAVWLATQGGNNNAMRPSVHPKKGYWQFLRPLAQRNHLGGQRRGPSLDIECPVAIIGSHAVGLDCSEIVQAAIQQV